jgi:hypothetical protein
MEGEKENNEREDRYYDTRRAQWFHLFRLRMTHL